MEPEGKTLLRQRRAGNRMLCRQPASERFDLFHYFFSFMVRRTVPSRHGASCAPDPASIPARPRDRATDRIRGDG